MSRAWEWLTRKQFSYLELILAVVFALIGYTVQGAL